MSYDGWVEIWKMRLFNEHFLEIYGEEKDNDEIDFYSDTLDEEL